MTTRRTFIKTLAALPPALSFGRSWAASDSSRLALIIGNGAYPDAPLGNPTNDAKAVAGLFTQAGFTVDSRLNATREEMLAAIERFGAAAKRPETKLVVFYYAGHGAQLDWRNYLLPVDAVVRKQEDMKQRCVDLGLLLGQLSAAKDKTFVVILDACRNNPFGRSYQPEQKGLSQFDAPVGSLLAYATAPGNVAADGEGQNGLYTENLVRELSRRDTRIEDALKRVRLNVRLASHGEQIPWETTSLEGDVFIFEGGQNKLSEAELEKLVEADVSEWTRIRSSKKIDDWVGYLRNFPNGRFAEISQMRLTRLLEEAGQAATDRSRAEDDRLGLESENPAPTKAAEAAVVPPPTQIAVPPGKGTQSAPGLRRRPAARLPRAPAIVIRAGEPVPPMITPSANPFSAGRYPLGRIYTVGDAATFRQSDLLTGIEERTYVLHVTRVAHDEDLVEYNHGMAITDLMGNPIKAGETEYETPLQLVPAEFQVGKKWTATFIRTRKGRSANAYYDMQIVKRESIDVPAGTFDTFRIEGRGWNTTDGSRLEMRAWLVPGLNFPVKREYVTHTRKGLFGATEKHELVALRQFRTVAACAVRNSMVALRSECAN